MHACRAIIIALIVVPLGTSLPGMIASAQAQMAGPGFGGPGARVDPPKKDKKPRPPGVIHEEEQGLLSELGLPSGNQIKQRFLTAIGQGPNEEIARQAFAEGDELFRAGKYQEAYKKYKTARRRLPDSSLEEDAMFMMAECLFFMDKYPAASDLYGEVLRKFDNSRHLNDIGIRQFTIGRYWDELQQSHPKWILSPNLTDKTRPRFDTVGNALAVYESIHLNDPTGPLADDSIMATANAHFLSGRYEDADYYYTVLRTDYPQSDHQPAAHVLGLRAKLRKYQGPAYDGTPLHEADELISQMLIQFPQELAGERERLLHAQRAIRAQLAERDWAMAEYYHKNGYDASARQYYDLVVKEYSDTPFAELAQSRIQKIGDDPVNPPNNIEWLANPFKRDTKTR